MTGKNQKSRNFFRKNHNILQLQAVSHPIQTRKEKQMTKFIATLITLSLVSFAVAEESSGKKGGKKGKPSKEEMLKKFDKDGDGKLSEDEKAAAQAARAKKIAQYDTDGDGKLSDAERQAMKDARKKKGGKGKKESAE